jgi:hypothetical protein
MYISIDVGIKNLAYVIYDKDIIDWKVVELCDKTQNASKLNMIEVGKKLYEALETIHYPITEIIIENQIGQNAIRMKIKTTYSQRKKYSVQITRELVTQSFPAQQTYFETHKKKDDLADCLLQLIDFLGKQSKLPESIDLICNAINLKF